MNNVLVCRLRPAMMQRKRIYEIKINSIRKSVFPLNSYSIRFKVQILEYFSKRIFIEIDIFKFQLISNISKWTVNHLIFKYFQGFESRGTDISNKLSTWENLLDSISHVGPLTTNPIQPVTAAKKGQRKRKNKKRNKKNRQKRDVSVENLIFQNLNGKHEFNNLNYSIRDPPNMKIKTGRWKREEAAPVYSSEHRIAWLCGDPSKILFNPP
jgi:hypothetical protein